MAIRFMDGFDQFDGQTDVAAAMRLAGYGVEGKTDISVGRTSSTRAITTEGLVQRTFSSSATKVVIGFAYCAQTARATIVSIKDFIDLEWPGALKVNSVVGVAKPIIGVWYYYEIVIDKDNHEVRIYINNELDFSVAIPDEKMFIKDYVITWECLNNTGGKSIDDLMIIDSNGGTNKDRVGPVALTMRLPRSDVITEFSVNNENFHFANVNQLPPKDGSYIQSNVSKAVDMFLSNDPVPQGDPIAVGMVAIAKKSDIDGRQMGFVVGDAKGDNKEVLITDINTENNFYYGVFETDPKDQPWTNASVQSMPFGVKVRP